MKWVQKCENIIYISPYEQTKKPNKASPAICFSNLIYKTIKWIINITTCKSFDAHTLPVIKNIINWFLQLPWASYIHSQMLYIVPSLWQIIGWACFRYKWQSDGMDWIRNSWWIFIKFILDHHQHKKKNQRTPRWIHYMDIITWRIKKPWFNRK